ncbi:MAG: hypothetical protein AAF721_20555 [Myxococcota bacterium]
MTDDELGPSRGRIGVDEVESLDLSREGIDRDRQRDERGPKRALRQQRDVHARRLHVPRLQALLVLVAVLGLVAVLRAGLVVAALAVGPVLVAVVVVAVEVVVVVVVAVVGPVIVRPVDHLVGAPVVQAHEAGRALLIDSALRDVAGQLDAVRNGRRVVANPAIARPGFGVAFRVPNERDRWPATHDGHGEDPQREIPPPRIEPTAIHAASLPDSRDA